MAPDRLRAGKVTQAKTVLVDSSFLISLMEHPTPWLEDLVEKVGGFEPVVIRPVYEELVRLAESGRGRGRFAAAAVNYVRDSKMKVVAVPGSNADDELVSRALSTGALVATIDSELIAQLKAARVGVVSLHSGRVQVR